DPISGHSHSISGSVSKITDPQLQQGLAYIKKGDRYRDRGDFDKAKAKYEKASKFYPSEAHDRLTILPLCKASKASNSDSDRIFPTGVRARLHHVKEKVKQTLKTPSQISTPHQYFFPSPSLSTQSTLASLANTDSQSMSESVSTCMSTPTLTTHSTVGTPSTLASEIASDVGIVSDVCSMAAACKIADVKVRETIDNKAYDIIKQFGESPITFDTVQELVVLAEIQDRDVFLHITTKILHVLRDMPLLASIPLQGLAVILDFFPDEIDLGSLHGAFAEILKPLQSRLADIRTANNDGQLLPLLSALNSLLDAMVRRGVSGLDRISVYDDLRTRLGSLTSHPNVMVCFQALYAKQALTIIGNDESLPMNIIRRGKLAFILAGNISKMAVNLDISSAESAYQNIKEIFDLSIRDRWYQGLTYVDYLVGQHSWRQLEDFVLCSKFQSDVCFQLGVVLRLEQIAVVQTDAVISNGAIKLLIALGTKPIPLVPEMVQSTLLRLGISDGSTNGTEDDMAVLFPPKSSISSQDHLRPVWDPAWHARPKGILLKTVHDRDQHNAIVANLPAQHLETRKAIQSTGSEVIRKVDQMGKGIQQLEAVITASLPSQSSLKDIQSALNTYYAPYLSILRVSGDELRLETCFVNLAIVEAPTQREKEKQDLKEQAAVFHRIPSFEVVERTNVQSSIPLEQLFNKRKLRDGKEDVPKRIL
ncbi:hypothetical protein BGX28_000734, partial [Mortierella sp. GBA30]